MAKMVTVNMPANGDVGAVVQGAAQQMVAQGYEVQVTPINPGCFSMEVKKSYEGFSKVIGLGVQCRATVTAMNGVLNVNVDSEWVNKILAMAIGWFICFIPLITGIVGCVNQSGLADKIISAIQVAVSGGGYNPPPYGANNGYGNPNPQQ